MIRAADGRTMRTGLTRVLANIGALLALGGPIGLVWLMAPGCASWRSHANNLLALSAWRGPP